MGVTDRTVQNYKKELQNGQTQRQNNSGKIVKKLTGIERYFTDLDIDAYSSEEKNSFRQAAIPAINTVMQMLDIDVKDL